LDEVQIWIHLRAWDSTGCGSIKEYLKLEIEVLRYVRDCWDLHRRRTGLRGLAMDFSCSVQTCVSRIILLQHENGLKSLL
jgi:hypothetical protein